MTIKQWFYKHVNITFILLVAFYFVAVGLVAKYAAEDAWVWLVIWLFVAIWLIGQINSWWRDRL